MQPYRRLHTIGNRVTVVSLSTEAGPPQMSLSVCPLALEFCVLGLFQQMIVRIHNELAQEST